jgi:mannose-6-phosphate isomerase-like protein (cupin superfamily)
MEIPQPFKDTRPWGEELWLTKNSPSMVKILTVLPGEANSLQFHHKRDEFWYILSGNGTVEIGAKKLETKEGDNHFIPRETKHRFTGGTKPLVLLEITYGEFEEKDIVRLEDRYGRM